MVNSWFREHYLSSRGNIKMMYVVFISGSRLSLKVSERLVGRGTCHDGNHSVSSPTPHFGSRPRPSSSCSSELRYNNWNLNLFSSSPLLLSYLQCRLRVLSLPLSTLSPQLLINAPQLSIRTSDPVQEMISLWCLLPLDLEWAVGERAGYELQDGGIGAQARVLYPDSWDRKSVV